MKAQVWTLVHFPKGSIEYDFAARVYTAMHKQAQMRAPPLPSATSYPPPVPRQASTPAQPVTAASRQETSHHDHTLTPEGSPQDDAPGQLAGQISPLLDHQQEPEQDDHRLELIQRFPKPCWMKDQAVIFNIDIDNIFNHFPNTVENGKFTKMSVNDFSPNDDGIYTNAYLISFVPPKGRVEPPQDEHDKVVITFYLTEAILNIDGVHDNERSALMTSHWVEGSASMFPRWQVEVISREVLVSSSLKTPACYFADRR